MNAYQSLLNRLQNNKTVATILVFGVAITALATLGESWTKLENIYKSLNTQQTSFNNTIWRACLFCDPFDKEDKSEYLIFFESGRIGIPLQDYVTTDEAGIFVDFVCPIEDILKVGSKNGEDSVDYKNRELCTGFEYYAGRWKATEDELILYLIDQLKNEPDITIKFNLNELETNGLLQGVGKKFKNGKSYPVELRHFEYNSS